jgi:hypothetical protein
VLLVLLGPCAACGGICTLFALASLDGCKRAAGVGRRGGAGWTHFIPVGASVGLALKSNPILPAVNIFLDCSNEMMTSPLSKHCRSKILHEDIDLLGLWTARSKSKLRTPKVNKTPGT